MQMISEGRSGGWSITKLLWLPRGLSFAVANDPLFKWEHLGTTNCLEEGNIFGNGKGMRLAAR